MLREFFKRNRKIDQAVQTDDTEHVNNIISPNIKENNEIGVQCDDYRSTLSSATTIPITNEYNYYISSQNDQIITHQPLSFNNDHIPQIEEFNSPYFFQPPPSVDDPVYYYDSYCKLTRSLLILYNYPEPDKCISKKLLVTSIKTVYYQLQQGCILDMSNVSNYGKYGKIIWCLDAQRSFLCCCSSGINTNIVINIGLPLFIGFTVEDSECFLSYLKVVLKSDVKYYEKYPE